MAELKSKIETKPEAVENIDVDLSIPNSPVEVRNVSGRVLNLAMGQVDKNDTGWATPAEIGILEPQYIVRV